MIGLMFVTPFGFVLVPVFLLSVLLAYKWLKSGNKQGNAGCFSVGIASLVIFMLLAVPTSISFQFFENGIQEVRIAIIAFWVIVISVIIYLIKSGNYRKIGSFAGRGCLYGVVPLMIFGMAAGLGYFVYLRMFTNEKDDAPLWATLLAIFFLLVLLMLPFGLWAQRKQNLQTEVTTFDNLESAKLKPEGVIDLNLSNTGLSAFPVEIFKFKNLELLDLSNNQISEIPDEIRRMKKLMSLNMAGNPIADKERIRIRRLFTDIEVIF